MRPAFATLLLKPNERVGLFGGSFDPVHQGHLHVAQTALEALKLDRLIVFVTPANPLKHGPSIGFETRLRQARIAFKHPQIIVSDAEQKLGIDKTYDLIAALKHDAKETHFVWVMGGDNLHSFDKWYRWQDLAALVPIAIVARGERENDVLDSSFSKAFAGTRLAQKDAAALAISPPPAWVYLSGQHVDISSSQMREARDIAQKEE